MSAAAFIDDADALIENGRLIPMADFSKLTSQESNKAVRVQHFLQADRRTQPRMRQSGTFRRHS